MELYFVGGASSSGKTTVIPILKKHLASEVAFYDFDDIGVPKNADKKWRQESTELWLQKLLTDGKNACMLGQIVLGEILACPSAKKIKKINFCFLDVDDFERIQRLKKRNTNDADQNMLNWASWLRMHIQNPQWMQHVIKDGAWKKLNFSIWDQLYVWPKNVFVKIINTTNLSTNETASFIINWIKKQEPLMVISKKYRHYKGGLYEVLGIAKHSENGETMVVYKALYGDFSLWVRPIEMFFEDVVINGKKQKRFELIDDKDQNPSI